MFRRVSGRDTYAILFFVKHLACNSHTEDQVSIVVKRVRTEYKQMPNGLWDTKLPEVFTRKANSSKFLESIQNRLHDSMRLFAHQAAWVFDMFTWKTTVLVSIQSRLHDSMCLFD